MLTYRRAKSKPTRVSSHHGERFGAGLLGTSPNSRLTVPLSDLEWAMMSLNLESASDWDEDTLYDQQFAESRAIDALTSGFIPDDIAAMIERTRI